MDKERDSIVVTLSWDVPEDWDDARRDLHKREVARTIMKGY